MTRWSAVWSRELQQFGQCSCAGTMHSRPNSHFDGLQVKTASLAAIIEDHAQ
jgi:hypothetical protein